ncbi:MAG: hypothetical protein KDD50_12450, partial [Bdellovibrionales bacterium]|nr:hypothetical protein [Bdellovibrionales bacterium]
MLRVENFISSLLGSMDRFNLPPQAYTREDLQEAFEWLKSQPISVKERASSPDLLVSLYNHAKRHGASVFSNNNQGLKGPIKSNPEDFKSDLKNLAKGLRQFDEKKVRSPEIKTVSDPSPSVQIEFEDYNETSKDKKEVRETSVAKVASPRPIYTTNKESESPATPHRYVPETTKNTVSSDREKVSSQKDLPAVSTTHRSLKEIPETTPIMAEGSDPKTLAILNEVKANLNLSQDY